MSHIVITDSGKLYHSDPAAVTLTLSGLPANVTIMSARSTGTKYRRKTCCVGRHSPGVVWHDNIGAWSKLGLAGPTSAPTLATTGSGVVSGTAVGYYTALHKSGTTTIQESNPSPPTSPVTFSLQQRLWTLPASHTPDSRATHFRLYVSMGGSVPRFVQDVTLGTTSVTENVSNTTLAAPTNTTLPVNSDGDVDSDARGVPPYSLYDETYHDSVWYAGNPTNPDRIYPSKLYEPESVNSTEVGPLSTAAWLRTLDGEAVTGLKRHGDELIVFCTNAAYAIQGYGPHEYSIRKISNFFGCISHHSLRRVGENADLWGAGYEGVWIYDGAFRFAMEDLRDYWRTDYEANKANYEASWAEEDRAFGGYKLNIPQSDETSFAYYGHYEPTRFGAQPWWVFDVRNREDSCSGILYGNGDQHGQLYTGSCDGYLRRENVMTNDNDDSDTYGKKFDFTTKHYWLNGDQAGNDDHGAAVTDIDLYAKHENDDLTVSLYCGDDDARSGVAQWAETISANAVSGKVAKTSRHLTPSNASGKGVSLRGEASSPIGVEYRGATILSGPGVQDRPSTS